MALAASKDLSQSWQSEVKNKQINKKPNNFNNTKHFLFPQKSALIQAEYVYPQVLPLPLWFDLF